MTHFLIGEQGPELRTLPAGTKITPYSRLLAQAQAARDGNAELQQATNDLTASVDALVDLPHPDDKEQQ